MTSPRNFGKLTDAEAHELGHIQELQRLVDHMREHFYSLAGKRLEVPNGTAIQVAQTDSGPYLVENLPSAAPAKASSPRRARAVALPTKASDAPETAPGASQEH